MSNKWDPIAQRYGVLQQDGKSILYDGDDQPTQVDANRLQEAGTVFNWMRGEMGEMSEVMFNVASRSALNVIYDKKGMFDKTVKEFAICESIYTLFAKDYLAWISNIMYNAPRKVTDPRVWFTSSDIEGAANHTIGLEIVSQIYQMVVNKRSFKLSLPDITRNIVALTAANILQRRSQSAGTSYRQQ